jgi:glycosyltransferase involved in cell wall biosynthesis
MEAFRVYWRPRWLEWRAKVIADNAAKIPLKIAVEGYPFWGSVHGGPDVFVRRLTESIISQKLAKIGLTKFPFYDIALFKVTSKSLYNRPFVLRVDGIYFDTKNTVGNTEKLNADIFSSIDKSDGVIFISEFSKKMVEKFHKKILKPTVIIHNTVDTSIFTPYGPNFRSKLNFSKDVRVIVTSAHWRRHKRLKETVMLFNRMRKTSKYACKLLVLGGNPDYVVEDKDIIYVGEVKPDVLPPWYRTADLYVHLAWIEPCGNTQIEAMACGLPIVCTNNGGIGETIIKANGGIVSNADEPYNLERLDYYNPPEPNYEVLMWDIEKIFEDYQRWVEKIDYHTLDINNAAKQYVEFITQVYNSTNQLRKFT